MKYGEGGPELLTKKLAKSVLAKSYGESGQQVIMKKYQIALLSFALGIFVVTSFVAYYVKRISEEVVVPQETPATAVEYKTVKIFFSNSIKDPDTTYCDRTYPVERAVSRLSDNIKSALGEYAYLAIAELLKGPAGYEKENGYFTSINKVTRVQQIIIEGGIATIDFNDKLDEGVAGSCKVQAIRSQVTETLKQFPEILEVVISINGDSETILQP